MATDTKAGEAGAMADWDELVRLTHEVFGIRTIEAAERQLIARGRYTRRAYRMLKICLVNKAKLEDRIAYLTDKVIDDPYWDDQLAGWEIGPDGRAVTP